MEYGVIGSKTVRVKTKLVWNFTFLNVLIAAMDDGMTAQREKFGKEMTGNRTSRSMRRITLSLWEKIVQKHATVRLAVQDIKSRFQSRHECGIVRTLQYLP